MVYCENKTIVNGNIAQNKRLCYIYEIPPGNEQKIPFFSATSGGSIHFMETIWRQPFFGIFVKEIEKKTVRQWVLQFCIGKSSWMFNDKL